MGNKKSNLFKKLPVRQNFTWKKTCIAIAVFILILILYLAVVHTNNKRRIPVGKQGVDCTPYVEKSKELIDQKKAEEAYSYLKSNESECFGSKGNVIGQERSASQVNFRSNIAEAAWQSNDKEAAKTYATQALEINDSMSDEQRANVKDRGIVFLKMIRIQNGNYKIESETTE